MGDIEGTFSWTPNKQPNGQEKKDIKFYFYIPAQWPRFYVTEFAAFQVLFYLTILQQFLYEVSTKTNDWLDNPDLQNKPDVWAEAFTKAQRNIDKHHENIKSAKTDSTLVEFSSQMNSTGAATATSPPNQNVAQPGTPKQTPTNLLQMNSTDPNVAPLGTPTQTPLLQMNKTANALNQKTGQYVQLETPTNLQQKKNTVAHNGQTNPLGAPVNPQSAVKQNKQQQVTKNTLAISAKQPNAKTPQSVTSDQIAAAAVATHITQNSKP